MSEWLGLAGARVLIAGAGAIGTAVAHGFTAVGARVCAVDVDPERIDRLEVEAARVVDLSTSEQCAEVVRDAAGRLGGLDVLVHCLGVNDRKPVDRYADDEWERILTLNLSTAFWLTRAAVPILKNQQSGRILFFSSVAGRLGHKHHGPYAATKAGLDQLARVLANELASDGITVNTIAPGYTETDLTSAYLADDAIRQQLLSLIPSGRFGTVEDLVGPTLFLASRQAGFVNGHVLYVDGARTVV